MKLVYQYMTIFKTQQIIFIHYKSRIATAIVVDEDGNGKFRLERVKERFKNDCLKMWHRIIFIFYSAWMFLPYTIILRSNWKINQIKYNYNGKHVSTLLQYMHNVSNVGPSSIQLWANGSCLQVPLWLLAQRTSICGSYCHVQQCENLCFIVLYRPNGYL